MAPDPLRIEGELRSWNDDRGYGFLRSEVAGDTFVHATQFTVRPADGQRFAYEVALDSEGRAFAQKVRSLARSAVRRRQPRKKSSRAAGAAGLLAIPAIAVLLFALVVGWQLPQLAIWVYGGASIVALIAYSADKVEARFDGVRVPESTLLGIGLLGGWPGAILAQQLFRHKTIKTEFQRAFWLTVLVNVLALVTIAAVLHYDLLGSSIAL